MRVAAVLAAFLLVEASSLAVAASRITTLDGTVFVGEIERSQNGIYFLRTPYGVMQIPARFVRHIENDGSGPGEGQALSAKLGGTLRLAGSNTIGAELVPELLKQYAEATGAKSIREERGGEEDWTLHAEATSGAFNADVASHGSATAVTALVAGQADIGMMSRQIKRDEIDKLAAIGFGQANVPGQEHVLALDGVAVLVNKSNPVTELTLANVAALFSGAVSDWSQLGGKSGRVQIYARDDKSGTYDTFKTLVLGDRALAASAKRYEDSEELSDTVSADPGGIGFVGLAYVRNARALFIRTECGTSYAPTAFAVRTEEYPLARRLFLYTERQPANPKVAEFVEYALSTRGQSVVDGKGFVSLAPQLSSREYVGERIALAARAEESDAKLFAAFAKGVANSLRLSITYRFQSGRSELDTRAVRDIDRLAELLARSENGGRRVLLAGFSDSVGDVAHNVALATQRAEAVARQLRQHNVKITTVVGYGPVAPVACNSSDNGREKNRRVEVWLQ